LATLKKGKKWAVCGQDHPEKRPNEGGVKKEIGVGGGNGHKKAVGPRKVVYPKGKRFLNWLTETQM